MTIAIYPGTFDPITCGHLDIILRSAPLFDHVIVAVASGHHKDTMLGIDERVALVQGSVEACKNVSVIGFDGLLADVIKKHCAQVILRGARHSSDFDQELQLALANKQLAGVDTFFLTPSLGTQFISSSLIREIFKLGGDIRPFVPENVVKYLSNNLSGRRHAAPVIGANGNS